MLHVILHLFLVLKKILVSTISLSLFNLAVKSSAKSVVVKFYSGDAQSESLLFLATRRKGILLHNLYIFLLRISNIRHWL